MSGTETRINADIEALLESVVFQSGSVPDKQVLGDLVRFTAPARGELVAQIDAYVPRHLIGKDAAKLKLIKGHFEAIENLRSLSAPQSVPDVISPASLKGLPPVAVVAGCPYGYFPDADNTWAHERLADFKGLMASLAELHTLGLIHGNIHEGSIRKEHHEDHPRLCDLAMHTGEPTALPEEALLYHSAELRQSMTPDVQSDLYAAGMIGYRIMLGVSGPYRALTGGDAPLDEVSLATAVKRGPQTIVQADAFTGLAGNVPQKLAKILARMVGAPGEQPYSSIDEVNAALQSADMGGAVEQPVAAEAKTWSTASLAVAASLAVLLLGSGAYNFIQRGELADLSATNANLASTLRSRSEEVTTHLATIDAKSSEIDGLQTAAAAQLAAAKACVGNMAPIQDGLPGSYLWPALQAAQADIANAIDQNPDALTQACARRDAVLALAPAARQLDAARLSLAAQVDDVRSAPFADTAAIDLSVANGLLQSALAAGADVTADGIDQTAAALRESSAQLEGEVSAYQAALSSDLVAARQAIAQNQDGLHAFWPPEPDPAGNATWTDLLMQQRALHDGLRAATAALDAALGSGTFVPPSEPVAPSEYAGYVSELRTDVATRLETAKATATELQQNAAAFRSRSPETFQNAQDQLVAADSQPNVIARAAAINAATGGFRAVVQAAETQLSQQVEELAGKLSRLAEGGAAQADDQTSKAFEAASVALGAVQDAEDLNAAFARADEADGLITVAAKAFANTQAGLTAAIRRHAELVDQAISAQLTEFGINQSNVTPDTLGQALKKPETNGIPSATLQQQVAQSTEVLQQALQLASRMVETESNAARSALSDLGPVDDTAALGPLFDADEARKNGALWTATLNYRKAARTFAQIAAARSAPRNVTIGFAEETLAQLNNPSRANECLRCKIFIDGAEERSATLRPFGLDREEATFNAVLTAFDQADYVADSTNGTRVGLVRNGVMNWDTATTLSLAGKAERLGPLRPASGLSARDAETYCKLVGKRLPTEAEWEYLASGGGKRLFSWSENERPKTPWDSFNWSSTAGALSQRVSPEGYLGLSGGVAEWVTTDGGFVLKGGSYRAQTGIQLAVSSRLIAPLDIAGDDHGVRCAFDLERWPE
ncbi:hypothetical protein ACMU_08920 [Actibacterium mucosum KCTC 23349]|uniref:Sulfatase-modifying factor enzyme-like domain-containing protein n=1 Tax=Actibacterium mucosum KCTC 23349 TaxID=1454373 RepID=A0A037ZHH6_9RHOB|nr:SUMF1/EgtB/PvdO family nonheme iron enzyme [Actibacterium mucosum]KAJ55880.1 hypothetical protein ACMU_08920 [Actibacterium mucosum KCTC 23349]